ncbi:hypothetical protein [Vibrio splendidus]|uniref:hypothetical protein n=1 Tax=Vibrio splendidus TaxID=29497 RepID=UPI0011B24D97|nr:hypothetical protein [Vibrio splendidus]
MSTEHSLMNSYASLRSADLDSKNRLMSKLSKQVLMIIYRMSYGKQENVVRLNDIADEAPINDETLTKVLESLASDKLLQFGFRKARQEPEDSGNNSSRAPEFVVRLTESGANKARNLMMSFDRYID